MEIKIQKVTSGVNKVFLIPLFKDSDFASKMPAELRAILKKRQQLKDFTASPGQSLLLLPDSVNLPAKILLCGFGKKEKLSEASVRNSAALAIKEAKKLKVQQFAMIYPERLAKYGQAFGEGLGMGNYNPAKFQTGKNKQNNEKTDIKKITIFYDGKDGKLAGALHDGLEIAAAVNEVRDLVNAPPTLKTVNYMAEKAREVARQNGYKITVIDKKKLEQMGMGALIGVNRGSTAGAKLVILEHHPRGSSKKPVVIAGKGIIFDSGGYNLKPSAAMANMNLDMAGAASVIGLFMLLKKLKVKQHVVGIFALTENLIDANAQKPSDIVTTYSGKTVEITNTDAEGRLILCDTVSYAIKKWEPRYLIDIATLTGACMVALGERYAGLFCNDKELAAKLEKAGKESDELLWPLPLHPDYAAKMKSKIADLRNSDESPYAGASKGAAFIQYFVGKTPWAHLDIAGPAHVKEPKKYENEMATGYGVRLFLQFLRNL